MNKLNSSYIAGYIDGDGCFYIGKTKLKNRIAPKYRMAIIISSTNIDVLQLFKSQFGGSISSKKQIKDHKQMHYISFQKKDSLKLCDLIEDYIVERKEQLAIYKEFACSDNPFTKNSLIHRMSIVRETSDLVAKAHKQMLTSLSNTVIPTQEDFAYLAGFIDAECCFGIHKHKPKDKPNFVYKIILQFNDTKIPVFKWLIERFGGHVNFINRINKGHGRKNQLTWRLSGNALSKITHKILPFIKHKKPVLKKIIEFYNTTLKNGGDRHTQEFKDSYAAIIQERETIINTIHILNLKGNTKH